MKKALIVAGGWEGHQPMAVAELLASQLRRRDFDVEISDALSVLSETEELRALDLIVPQWTMGTIAKDQLDSLLSAVRSGVGTGGVHGMADAFRNEPEYQFMVGGQWVAHPGGDGVRYEVNVTDVASLITAGIDDFTVVSEQYYLHVDPAITVLATTNFGATAMPVVWTKRYGDGRVFYCSIGHDVDVLSTPPVLEIVTRGLIWAAGGELG